MKAIQQHSVRVALVVAAILGGWLLLDLRKPVHEPGENPKVSDIVGINSADVRRIEISAGAKNVSLVRAGAGWNIEQPIKAGADPEEVKRILDDLLDRSSDMIFAEPVKDLAKYKLDKPAVQVRFTGASGKTLTVGFGDKDPAKSNVYARELATGKVFLVPSSGPDALLAKTASDLRDKTILSVAPESVTGIKLQGEEGTVELKRGSDNKWILISPWNAPADENAVASFLSSLNPLKASRFVDSGGARGKYGLDKPKFTLVITSKSGGTYTLPTGSADKSKSEVYALCPQNEVVSFTEGTIKSLQKPAADLRSRRILDLDIEKVQSVSVRCPNGQWEVKKNGQDWTFVKPNAGQKANRESVEGFLRDMASPATRHVEENANDLVRYGLDKPSIEIDLTLADGAKKKYFVGKKSDKNEYFARGSDSPNAVFAIASFTFEDLNKKPDALK